MTKYLAMVGDVVVGAGDSAIEAILDAETRAIALGYPLEQAGRVYTKLVGDEQPYEIGETICWTDNATN